MWELVVAAVCLLGETSDGGGGGGGGGGGVNKYKLYNNGIKRQVYLLP